MWNAEFLFQWFLSLIKEARLSFESRHRGSGVRGLRKGYRNGLAM